MTATRSPIAVILADLLVVQSQQKLPAWLSVNAGAHNPVVSIECFTGADLLAWHEVLGGDDMRRHTSFRVDGVSYSALVDRLGWVVSLRAHEPWTQPESLPAETVAALSEVTAQPTGEQVQP